MSRVTSVTKAWSEEGEAQRVLGQMGKAGRSACSGLAAGTATLPSPGVSRPVSSKTHGPSFFMQICLCCVSVHLTLSVCTSGGNNSLKGKMNVKRGCESDPGAHGAPGDPGDGKSHTVRVLLAQMGKSQKSTFLVVLSQNPVLPAPGTSTP